jgi:hypothetical protein
MMIRSVVVSMLPPYPRPAASGPRSEYQYGSFRASTQRGSPTDGVSIMPESVKRCLDPCIRPAATHAEASRSGVETCARQKTPPRLNFSANSRPAPVQP